MTKIQWRAIQAWVNSAIDTALLEMDVKLGEQMNLNESHKETMEAQRRRLESCREFSEKIAKALEADLTE